jgi:uncharacterized membrane protein YuzA (DUF378 family)
MMEWLNRIVLALIIIGALNWLLVGLFEWDLITALFGGETLRQASTLSKVIYTLVGLSGLYAISFFFRENAAVRNNK